MTKRTPYKIKTFILILDWSIYAKVNFVFDAYARKSLVHKTKCHVGLQHENSVNPRKSGQTDCSVPIRP